MIQLWFSIPLDTKQVILEMLFPANLMANTEKTQAQKYNKPRLTQN